MGQPTVPRSGFWRSFSFAGQGVWHVVRTQRNMRVHLAAALVAVAAGVILPITSADGAAVVAGGLHDRQTHSRRDRRTAS